MKYKRREITNPKTSGVTNFFLNEELVKVSNTKNIIINAKPAYRKELKS